MAYDESRPQRRSFLSRFGIGLAAIGAAGAAPARAQQTSADAFKPALHPLDDWFDEPKVSHRMVFATTMPNGAGSGIAFANNFLVANKSGYGLEPKEIAIVVVLRHFSTPFAYNDAVWAKYGTILAAPANFTDPITKQAPNANLYNKTGYGFDLPNFGTTIDSLAGNGVRFAVCDMATHFFAAQIAQRMGGMADAVYKELAANLVPNSHLVPAGIVAVNRAQERGYTLATVA
jgi:intracellular sulfur oxidation DsrE/DsrF family protein